MLPAVVVCSLMVSITAAQAATMQFEFTGVVSYASKLLQPPLAGNQDVRGSFTIDNNTSLTGGSYSGVVKSFSLNFLPHSSSTVVYTASGTGLGNGVSISQGIPNSVGDLVDRWHLQTEPIGSIGNNVPFQFSLDLDSQNPFANNNMQSPPTTGSFDGSSWRLIFLNGNQVATVLGSVQTLTAVPLPAAVLLFGAGLISLVGLGAGGLRNLRTSKV